MPAEDAAKKPFDTLHTLLATARELAKTLSDDAELERLVRAFRMCPERDRETILEVIEKDASWRRIVETTDAVTGISVRPNPHASLYVHVLDSAAADAPLDPEPSPRDADVIRQGVQSFVQLLPLLFQESVHAQWTAAALEIARASDGELRTYAVRLAREVLQLLADVDRETPRG